MTRQPSFCHFFPLLFSLAERCLSIPVSNAWPERGASALKRVKPSLFYDPFYCNMICFTAVFKIITAVATCSYWLPILSLCFCPEPREEKQVSVRPNSTPPPLKDNCKTQKQSAQQNKFLFLSCMDTPIINFFIINSILLQSWPDHSAKRFMSTVCLILDHYCLMQNRFPKPRPLC